MDISPKLQMNLHPKDADNLSLVTALNIKLSNDGSCITNEESIRENTFIKEFLMNYYKSSEGTYYDYTIIGIIPCNNELVIIAINDDNPTKAQIFRYREAISGQTEGMKCVYGNTDSAYLEYHGGKIKGTFTYNVEDSLIIAIAEYDGDEEKIPLRTINLGNYDNDKIYNDIKLPNSMLSVSPEVRIPSMSNLRYVAGNAYKGWYYLYIRFKINSIDYTQWFNFGHPIFIDTLEKFAITKYCYRQKNDNMSADGVWNIVKPSEPSDGFCAGASDYFSNTSDIANETFKIDITFDKNDYIYKKYQIGIICASKSATRAFRTADIDYKGNANSNYVTEFILNNASLIEVSAEEFIIDNYNYFDVKNIINYKNRLYIANYKENNANDDSIIQSGIIDDIIVCLDSKPVTGGTLKTDITISGRQDDSHNAYNNQYDGSSTKVSATEFFNMSGDIDITLSGETRRINLDTAQATTQIETVTKRLSNVYVQSVYSNINGEWKPLAPAYITFSFTDGQNLVQFYKTVTITLSSGNNIHNTVIINCENYAINGGIKYINVKNSFNNRKQNPILIPGEVYNFFIHFVDKYGHCTNGYRLNNNIKWTTDDNTSTEIVPIPFVYNGVTYYAAMPIDSNVLYSGKLNTNGLRIYLSITSSIGASSYKLSTRITNTDVINAFSISFASFENSKYEDVKWFQIASGYNAGNFLPYYNNNGDKLFRVPIRENDANRINGYNLSVRNIKIPNGYVGYFISYEKFEPIKRITGILTRNDFRSQDYVERDSIKTILRTANTQKSDLMYFYSGQYDISDSIRLDYNIMRIDAVNVLDTTDIPDWDYAQRCKNYKFCHDMNKPQVNAELTSAPACYAPTEYKLVVADSAADARMGLGTALQLRDAYNLFPIYETTENINNLIKLYKVTFINASRDIYMSNNKTLIRCTNIMYGSADVTNHYVNGTNIFMNGFMTYDGCIVYENSGFNFNTANNIAYRMQNNDKYYKSDEKEKHTWQINCPFLAYLQFHTVDDFFYESKCFKNEPTGYVFYVKQDTNNLDKANENNKFAMGCIVTPANSIDLFENRQDSADTFNTKVFTNYREDLVSVDNFEKTIRRSAIIQDETRANGWRTFPVESYKNITENKGIITNLIGIGTTLLVHTEHSLFMFNTDNTLTTNESQKVQLTQPDAFEVNYIEVLTSSLGYGGLQDDKSFIVDQFGYIFYNNDFHRFYNFDNGKLSVIDDDIIQWLDKYKPYGVRFANDKFNNRLIIKMNYKVANEEKEILLSFNYGVNHFISIHNYTFEEAFNTKSKLYMKCPSNSHANCSLHEFIQDGTSYGNFDNGKNNIGVDTIYPSKIGIIVNEQFDNVKFLEHITYKLSKYANPANKDYANSPVEELIAPYSADNLRIYNNEVDTGILDILIDKEEAKNIFCNYTKPYWELGMWNYSYLRNKISERANYGDAFNMSRLFGNYFVVEFTFSNADNLKIEFEELKYNITK